MREHGVSEHETEAELWKQVVEAWKDINVEFLYPTVVPTLVLMHLNFS